MSQRTKVVGTRAPIIWLLIVIALVIIAGLAVGGLVIYPHLQGQRAEQARLAQAEQHYQAGVAFQNVSDWEAAEAEFKQVISIDANYKDVQARLAEVKVRLLEAHYQRALGLINLEQWAEAQVALQAVFALDPNYKDVQAQLAAVNTETAKLTPTATPTPPVTPTPESVPHAMIANTVPDGSITTEKIADEAVTAEKLAPGAAAQTLIWSSAENSGSTSEPSPQGRHAMATLSVTVDVPSKIVLMVAGTYNSRTRDWTWFNIERDGVQIQGLGVGSPPGISETFSMIAVDNVSPGTYTYRAQIAPTGSSHLVSYEHATFIAMAFPVP